MLTPKLWVALNLACQDASFGTLESQIGHMVMEILTAGKIPEEQEYNWILSSDIYINCRIKLGVET